MDAARTGAPASSLLSLRSIRVGIMKPVLPDLEEFMRACRASMRHLSEDEFEEIACIVYFFVRQQTIRPYGDVDDLAASLAFSTFPSAD